MEILKRDGITDKEIKDSILLKFFRMKAGRSRHIYESDIPKGMPPLLCKRVSNMVKELRREGFLVGFPHGKEQAFTLNMNRIDDIKKRIIRFRK